MSCLKKVNNKEKAYIGSFFGRVIVGDLYLAVGLGIVEVIEYPDCLWIENIDGRGMACIEVLTALRAIAKGRPIKALCKSESRTRLFRRFGFVKVDHNGRLEITG